ncbi:aspartyl-phosphate phosphatase Spo0E family protein [Virgibacillus necropolis]|uniref:Spo0E family sporulation regulatory protein-aspartic acid phosphatase n=1 Tax=Virgibacillus necropolis TaxID=163877 RepID=A0A221ME17_9BACI|nr:aspartyl-phosphate phosphatase Spo0E family protein [Virgibacillus necropolis]ASN05928.1 Spo0E family sporulation regulatory protein-aspartic acid phosphatase [Virgibacillus necropolis]
MSTIEQLLKRIEFLRNEMTKVALKKGFTSRESIMISQELDKLLNLYDSIQRKEVNKKKK